MLREHETQASVSTAFSSSGAFLNVIRYSKRMEILLHLVSFCPLK